MKERRALGRARQSATDLNQELKRLEVFLMSIMKRLTRLARKLDRLEEEATGITDDLQLLVEAVSEIVRSIWGNTGLPLPQAPDGEVELADAVLQKLADQGIDKVEIEPAPDGSAKVTLDNYPELQLSAGLTSLLEMLRLPIGESEDGLVGFKSLPELTLLLSERMHKPFKEHAVAELLRRLRKVIRRSGGNRYLVQTKRGHGHRLAVRQGDRPVIKGEEM